jgi:hypothetical protein
MDKGHPVDIVTGRPLDQKAEDRTVADLTKKAQYAGIAETAAGMMLTAEVESLLLKRINALVAQDPEAKAFLTVLVQLSYREDIGKRAVEALTKRLNLKK